MSEKPKRKRKIRPPMQFVTQLPLEACVKRLAEQETRLTNSKVSYHVFPVDENTYRFGVRKQLSRRNHSAITVDGYMKRHDNDTTLVVGKSGGSSLPLIGFSIVLFPALFMLVCSLFSGGWLTVLAFLALVVGVMLVIWVPTKLQEISLVHSLQRTLGYDG